MDLIGTLDHESSWRLAGPGDDSDRPGAYSNPEGGASRPLTPDEKRRRTVLVVEDEEDVREALLESLAEEGYGVTAVRNGVEAIRVLTYASRLPDIILLDLMMPVMDGWEFQRKLDKRDPDTNELLHPEWAQIPVVIYSANTKARPIKATVVLAKPISLEQLVATISAHIKPEPGDTK